MLRLIPIAILSCSRSLLNEEVFPDCPNATCASLSEPDQLSALGPAVMTTPPSVIALATVLAALIIFTQASAAVHDPFLNSTETVTTAPSSAFVETSGPLTRRRTDNDLRRLFSRLNGEPDADQIRKKDDDEKDDDDASSCGMAFAYSPDPEEGNGTCFRDVKNEDSRIRCCDDTPTGKGGKPYHGGSWGWSIGPITM